MTPKFISTLQEKPLAEIELVTTRGVHSLPCGLLVSGQNGGGFLKIDRGRISILDLVSTHGLWVTPKHVLRSIQHNNKMELVIYDLNHGSSTVFGAPGLGDIHDVRVYGELIYAVSTITNELAWFTLDGKEAGRKKFDGEGDSWHINCLDLWPGDRIVMSAFGRFKTHNGWSKKTAGAGIVIDVHTEENLWTGLSQPHNPRCDGSGRRLICNSADQCLIALSNDGSEQRTLFPGLYPRGLAITEKYLYVGLSQPRTVSLKADPFGIASASIDVLDSKSLQHLDTIPIPFHEVYDIALMDSA